MEVKDPVPTVAIPVTVGKRTIMVPLGTPEECDALILRVTLAKSMIIAAQAVLVVDAEIIDGDSCEWHGGTGSLRPGCPECDSEAEYQEQLAREAGLQDDDAWQLTPAGVAALDAEPEPEPGTQAYADKYSSPLIQQAFDGARPFDGPPMPPVTHLACGDQLHDHGAALLAVGAVAWCPVHGNAEVISAEEHAATAPDHDYVTPAMADRRDRAAAAYEAAATPGPSGMQSPRPVVTVPGPHPDASANHHGYAPDESGDGPSSPSDPEWRRPLALVPPAAGQ